MRKNILLLPLLCLILFGCNTKQIDKLRCVMDYESEMKLEQVFYFIDDSLSKIVISIDSSLEGVSKDNFDDSLTAMKSIVNSQNKLNGVKAKLDVNKETKHIKEKITVDITKYDLKEDGLMLFSNMKHKDITKKHLINKFIEDNYKVYLNDKLVQK